MIDTVDPLRVERDPTGTQLTFPPPGAEPGLVPVPPTRGVITGCCRAGTALSGPPRGAAVGYFAPGRSVPGSVGVTPTALVFGLRRSRPATQLANQESSMHIPM